MVKERNASSLDIAMSQRLYNPETKKMIVSRDVIFNEASKWS